MRQHESKMSWLWPVLAALSLAGCDCGGGFGGDCAARGGIAIGGGSSTDSMVVVGENARQDLALFSCDRATSATVTVMGPDNRPVEFQQFDVFGAGNNMVTVSFPAVLVGTYHASAQFEPSLGRVEADVWVAHGDRDAGPAFTRPLCERYEQLGDGVLCARASENLWFAADGGQTTLVSLASVIDVGGEFIWAADSNGGSLFRWKLEQGSLAKQPETCALGFPTLVVAASSSALVADSSQLAVLDVTNGGCNRHTIEGLNNTGFSTVGWNGRRGILTTSEPFGQMVSVSLDSPEAVLLARSGRGLAVDDHGLWVESNSVWEYLSLDTAGTEQRLPVFRGWQAIADQPRSHALAVTRHRDAGQDVVVSVDDAGRLDLQQWQRPGLRLHSVLPGYVVLSDSSKAYFFPR